MKKPLIIVAVLHVVFVVGILIFLGMNNDQAAEEHNVTLGQSAEDQTAATSTGPGASGTTEPAPAPRQTHTVSRGELLTSIARRYGVSVRALAQDNDLGVADIPEPGSTLVIPEGADAARDDGERVSLSELIENAPKAQKVGDDSQTGTDAGTPALPSSPTGIASVHHNLVDAGEQAAAQNQGSPDSNDSKRQTQTPSTPAPEGGYRVKQGDTLWSISRQFGTTPEKIKAANGISDAKSLQVGQLLQIPGN
jgi:LysM repeat protein